jgi:hypothetical protein
MPDDFMSFVPANIAAQGAEADRLMATAQGSQPSEPAPVQGTPAQAEPVITQSAIATAIQVPDNVELMKAEQRYRVLQGKYNTETAQLRDTVSALQRELQQLREAKAAQPAFEMSEFEAHGPEVQKLASLVSEQQRTIQELRSKLEMNPQGADQAKIQQIEERLNHDAQERYFQFLDTHIRGWENVNKHPAFHAWLEVVDPIAGRSRRDLLTEAAGNLDGPRVCQFFLAFRKAYEEANGQPSVMPGQTGAPPQANIAKSGFNHQLHATRAQLQAAQTEFQRGVLSEQEFDAVAIKFQRAFKDGVLG